MPSPFDPGTTRDDPPGLRSRQAGEWVALRVLLDGHASEKQREFVEASLVFAGCTFDRPGAPCLGASYRPGGSKNRGAGRVSELNHTAPNRARADPSLFPVRPSVLSRRSPGSLEETPPTACACVAVRCPGRDVYSSRRSRSTPGRAKVDRVTLGARSVRHQGSDSAGCARCGLPGPRVSVSPGS
jgi:hypothetical protein